MIELDIHDIISSFCDLRAYSRTLSRSMEHEHGLPDDAVPFLVEEIEKAFIRCEAATPANKGEANEELAEWLIKSYRFYVVRLAQFDTPWVFRFPSAKTEVRH